MKNRRPFIITIIGDLHILAAFSLLLSLFSILDQFGIHAYILTDNLNISALMKNLMVVFNIIVLIIISYGYLRLKTWGYWLILFYNIFSLIGWIVFFIQNNQQLFFQYIIPTIIELIFIIPTIKYFKNKSHENNL